jgi:hypothetical protein
LSDGAARLAARYPFVWHVLEAEGAGPWLAQTGLLPAGMLRRGGGNRDNFIRIEFGAGCVAVLRPQVMRDHRLLPTLSGAFAGRPEAWRHHVDAHVFFWTEPRRRDAFARACARLRGAPPVVLTLDTRALLQRHAAVAFFATINTGSTVRAGGRVRRDEDTLRPVATYRGGAVAELAIRGRVDLTGLRQRRESPAIPSAESPVRRSA